MFLRSNRIAVPRDLASVTTYDPQRETAPTDVGLSPGLIAPRHAGAAPSAPQ